MSERTDRLIEELINAAMDNLSAHELEFHVEDADRRLDKARDFLRAELAAANAEIAKLKGIIQRAEFINAEFHGDGVLCDKCAICEGYAMEGHTEDCPYYQWEASDGQA
jgi:hypothetical protein